MATVVPTLTGPAFVDVTGTSAIVTTMYPRGPDHTTVVTEYMFAPATIAGPGFDPSEIVEFSELVAKQDFDVCERVQRGVSSSRFTTGVLTPKDDSSSPSSSTTAPPWAPTTTDRALPTGPIG